MSTGCKICDDHALRAGVDDLLDSKNKYTFIARQMTARGFPVSADIVSTHAGHRNEYKSPELTRVQKSDLAAVIRDKMSSRIVSMDPEEFFDPAIQPALGTALRAQKLIDDREKKKPQQNFFFQLYQGQRETELPALPDPDVIDGEAIEV